MCKDPAAVAVKVVEICKLVEEIEETVVTNTTRELQQPQPKPSVSPTFGEVLHTDDDTE